METTSYKLGGKLKSVITEEDEAGIIGYDQFDQLTHMWQHGDMITSTPCISDVRDKICPICQKGWELTTKSWADQFWDHEWKRLLHKTCLIGHMTLNQRTLLVDALVDSRVAAGVGFPFESPQEIPNEYGGAWDTPWWLVRIPSAYALLKFGRRKRVDVIEIQLDDGHKFKNPEHIRKLMEENVTHSAKWGGEYEDNHFLIHAWTDEKVKEYIAEMIKAVGIQEIKR